MSYVVPHKKLQDHGIIFRYKLSSYPGIKTSMMQNRHKRLLGGFLHAHRERFPPLPASAIPATHSEALEILRSLIERADVHTG